MTNFLAVSDHICQQTFEQAEFRSEQFEYRFQGWSLSVSSHGFTRWVFCAIVWLPFDTTKYRTYGKPEWFSSRKTVPHLHLHLLTVFRLIMWHFHSSWCRMLDSQNQKPVPKMSLIWIWNPLCVFFTVCSRSIEMLPNLIEILPVYKIIINHKVLFYLS